MNEHSRVWSLQEAKARLSELVRLAQTDGPQKITLHGKHAVTVYPAAKEETVGRQITGQALIDAMQACPYKDEYPLVVPGEPMTINPPLDM
ncbi:MAG TPA: type II toxin-antitoxin system prevent-host-death family antitoxin [Aestuariivirga sp.]|nr:type II toxin-antitoxin system prevent-host-death family antitoxin [Aestuariivirga sp.]